MAEFVDEIGDEGDLAAAKNLIDLDCSITAHRVAELNAIDSAKTRMGMGHYGNCMDCGEPIAYKRLVACPTAQRCLRCQTLYEKTHL